MNWSHIPNYYADDVPLKKRQKCVSKITTTYPDRVPVVVQPASAELQLSKTKFLVPNTMPMGVFLKKLREYIIFRSGGLPEQRALFMLMGERQILVSPGYVMGDMLKSHVSEDGMLYIWVATENTFG